MNSADVHTLTGAYALHALSERESEEFARHLAACEACGQEVREFQETAARLALAAAETPSAEFRARVMAAIPEVRQLPPVVPGAEADTWSGSARRRSWRRRMPQFALAACLVLAVAAGGIAINAQHQVRQERARASAAQSQQAALTALLAAPDVSYRPTAVKGGGSGAVVSSASLRQAAFVFEGLPALPSSKVYQLWYSKDGQMVPAGLVPATAGGATMLTGTPVGAAGVGMTVEPAGGSIRPTSAPVVLVPLTVS